jgi:hypothetical protein
MWRVTGDFAVANSDLAFQGTRVIVGNFNGFQIYDVSDPSSPSLISAVRCPGGQGDVSVHGNLVFMSVEEPRGRVDCGDQGVLRPVSPDRFRGVRIFDISDIEQPRQVAAVQTCRGSHTHTLVPDARDASHVYIYVAGAAPPRPADELPGCLRTGEETGAESPLFRIEVIQVPLANPEQARVVNAPRLFADPQTGDIAGLWRGGRHGPGTQRTAATDHCHDITVYPAIGLAAGACSGNGILIDISDPANPVRIDEVVDPNFAYWHSATFNNAGTSVIYTDEWGGGTQPRCQSSDPPTWGANAIFTLSERRLRHAGYYKLPAPQTATENCVAHNGSLVPVPGRDIKVQAWYQGGISVFDFTDPANPVEIAFFDRGPLSATNLMLGGFWSAYWHNGYIYGSEIARGLDVLRLTPTSTCRRTRSTRPTWSPHQHTSAREVPSGVAHRPCRTRGHRDLRHQRVQPPGGAAQPVQERVRPDRRPAQAPLRPDPQPGGDGAGYMKHERETLEAVIQAGTRPARPSRRPPRTRRTPGAMRGLMGAEQALTGALGRFFALAEAYPDLKANQNMAQLQEELASTENRIAFARQAFNDAVMSYNTAREVFPTNLIAGFFSFTEAQHLLIDEPAEREVPRVSFGG